MTPSDQDRLEPLGDPDDETGDFAVEHEDFTADEPETEPEPESPDRYSGGLDREGPP
jgi:hypothetical protein